MLRFLLRRKAVSLWNALRALTPWERARNGAFMLVGLWMLAGLYAGFLRLLRYLSTVPIVGPLLIWKLTAMALMTMFAMVAMSSLIISLTTFFYSYDLPFLLRSPIGFRTVFMDKSLEAAFFSSWMIALALFPYFLALNVVSGLSWAFFAVFLVLMVPFLLLAAVIGMGFTLLLMYCFPSPRTRDVIWILASLSAALVYVLLRFSAPERLVRPDALQIVAQYLGYLQAPTAEYFPSWWMTLAMEAWSYGSWPAFFRSAGLLFGSAAGAYGLLIAVAGKTYAQGYSGAQEARRSGLGMEISRPWETRALERLGMVSAAPALLWKERRCFFRDVAHWSQMMLVVALMCVYLFSIHRLPLDSPDLKSLAAFLNLSVAGFVLASLGLRFTFPGVSLEGRNFWILRAAPVGVSTLMSQKFWFSVIPMTLLSVILVLVSNHLLRADLFVSRLSLATILVMTWTLCGMGVGFGALFPKFNIANIHQIESSAGGFIYMAACLFYVGLTLALEAPAVLMHFHVRFGRLEAWNGPVAGWCAAALLAVSAAAFGVPWVLGRRNLEAYEE